MIGNLIHGLNRILKDPSNQNIYSLFDREGFIRLNMLYISPVALRHLKKKIKEYELVEWCFTEKELIFKFVDKIISFKGNLNITQKPSYEVTYEDGTFCDENKIFSLELDFDPIVSSKNDFVFLKDVEIFLKECDACFFMTYPICIDTEILNNPLSKSVEFLANRK